MTALVVTDPGPSTTLQDGGRHGAARYGVPRSGPVDVLAHRLAARMAGFAPAEAADAVAVEVGPHPCGLAVQGGRLAVAVAGEEATVEHHGVVTSAPCVVLLGDGERCLVTARTWAYVVPAGCLDVPATMGSRSHHPRSGLGPSLGPGTTLTVTDPRRESPGRRAVPVVPGGPLRVLAAPQTDRFSAESLRRLVGEEYRTTPAFDRMGHRLEGPALEAIGGHDIVSDGVVAGAVQVPGDGRPYVLTADHQTTGGYPKIAVLAMADLARFVRLAPGTPVRLAWADVADARRRLHQAMAGIEEVVAGPVTPLGSVLGQRNLIAGVTDGTADDS